MGKPIQHAESSVQRFGGKIDDYIKIHEFLDSSQSAVSDLRHRMLTHNAWFITTIMPKIFGSYITNADGKNIAVQSICEYHVFEDLQRYPSAQDWANEVQWKDWMKNQAELNKAKETSLNHEPVVSKKYTQEEIVKIWHDYAKQPPNFEPVYNPNKSLTSDRLYKNNIECMNIS